MINKLVLSFLLCNFSLFATHKELAMTNKYKVTCYVESPTLSEVDVCRQLSRSLPFLNTQTMKIYKNFLEVETLDEFPNLEEDFPREPIEIGGGKTCIP